MGNSTEEVLKVCDEGSVEADVRKVLIIVFSVLIVLSNCLLILLISKTDKLRKKVLFIGMVNKEIIFLLKI